MHALGKIERRVASEREIEQSAAGIVYAVSGFVLGCVALAMVAVGYGGLVAITQKLLIVDVCGDGFPRAVIAVLLVLGLALSVAGGAWLLRLRKFVAPRNEPDQIEHSQHIRKCFTYGSMIVYVALTPGMWMLMYASANCTGA